MKSGDLIRRNARHCSRRFSLPRIKRRMPIANRAVVLITARGTCLAVRLSKDLGILSMRAIMKKIFWPFRYGAPDPGVIRDADRLMLVYGEQAYEAASAYSWREDTGLLFTQKPGHWHRVRLEIGHRSGRDEDTDLIATPTDIHPMTGLLSRDCRHGRTLARPNPAHGGCRAPMPMTVAAFRARTFDFIVIETHLTRGFCWNSCSRPAHAGAG